MLNALLFIQVAGSPFTVSPRTGRQRFDGGHSLGQSSGKPRALRKASYSAMNR
jgi:hypothetical protein